MADVLMPQTSLSASVISFLALVKTCKPRLCHSVHCLPSQLVKTSQEKPGDSLCLLDSQDAQRSVHLCGPEETGLMVSVHGQTKWLGEHSSELTVIVPLICLHKILCCIYKNRINIPHLHVYVIQAFLDAISRQRMSKAPSLHINLVVYI